MAKKLVTSYTFTPGGSGVGTVVVSGTYTLEQFLLITNVTKNVVIYEFDSSAQGGSISTGGGNTTLTLIYDTSTMSAGDRLQIFLDDGIAPQTSLASIDSKVPSNLTVSSSKLLVDGSGVTQPVSGPLTDTQLRATAVPVSGTVTANAGTNLNTSALALESGGNLASINTKLPALTSGSVPVLVQNGQLEITNDSGNAIPVGPAAMLQLTGSASTLNADLFSVDCSAYRSINFQITGTWVGTIAFQVSNDNTNWNSLGLSTTSGATTTGTTATVNNSYFGTLGGFNYVRARFTAYTSGTASVVGYLLREPVSIAINANTSTFPIVGSSSTSGVTLYTLNSAATTNAASIKASGANVFGLSVMNASAATKYVRLFNLTTAPTVGTSVPIMVVAVPATSSKEIEYVPALRFGTGLAVAITGGAAATDSTAVAAGDVQLLVSYL
jgi:hypothetical protein